MNFAAKAVLTGFAASVALSSVPAMAQTPRPEVYLSDTPEQGYVVRGPYDLCWRTGYWTPGGAAADKEWGCKCDKDLIAKEICEPPPPPAPPPPAPVEPAPVKLLPKKIEFSADALYDFDKSVLRPKGKEMLDELASVLSGATYDNISAIGYTDPIGSAKYNQGLSERRASSVKSYLGEKGIPAEKIKAEGRGKNDLKVTFADCKGSKGRKALIECLQPNRRTEVSVTGTKPQ